MLQARHITASPEKAPPIPGIHIMSHALLHVHRHFLPRFMSWGTKAGIIVRERAMAYQVGLQFLRENNSRNKAELAMSH